MQFATATHVCWRQGQTSCYSTGSIRHMVRMWRANRIAPPAAAGGTGAITLAGFLAAPLPAFADGAALAAGGGTLDSFCSAGSYAVVCDPRTTVTSINLRSHDTTVRCLPLATTVQALVQRISYAQSL